MLACMVKRQPCLPSTRLLSNTCEAHHKHNSMAASVRAYTGSVWCC
jgi:hypothetical protein